MEFNFSCKRTVAPGTQQHGYGAVLFVHEDTIVALATAPLPSGIAVIRISGDRTRDVLKKIFRAQSDPVDEPKKLIFGKVVNPDDGKVLDKGFAVYMKKPGSYTGEDTAELHVHGSPLIIGKILAGVMTLGVRMAEPGEFTRTAFLNGKIDLLQAEAVADLISAGSDRALSIASEQLEGRFSRAIEGIGEPLRDALAEIEASIDFVEEDIETNWFETIQKVSNSAAAKIDELISSYDYGHIVREGFRVLLCGQPNAGKSTLFNRILNKQRAIVTEVSGTTRDVIEESATIDGYTFVFCDSAGIRSTDDHVERIGIGLAMDRLEWADLTVVIVDVVSGVEPDALLLSHLDRKKKPCWLVFNKTDLAPKVDAPVTCHPDLFARIFAISALTGSGYDDFVRALCVEVQSRSPSLGETGTIVTNERQKVCLKRARDLLNVVNEQGAASLPAEIIASNVRSALLALEEMVGKTWTEDLLGRIFSRFCIGK